MRSKVTIIILWLVFVVATTRPVQAQTAPTISPTTGSFGTQQNVTMSVSGGSYPTVHIYYTTNGSQPTTSSSEFIPGTTAAIPITAQTQINAVTYYTGTGIYSAVTTAFLDVDPQLAQLVPSYVATRSGVGTEVFAYGIDSHNNITITITGGVSSGDRITVTTYVGGLPQGIYSTFVTAAFGWSTTDIATNLASTVNSDATLQGAGITAASSSNVLTLSDSLVLRARATFPITTGIGAPALVSTWYDLSGQSNNLTSSFGNEPVLLNSSLGSSVGFNGSSQYLSLPSGFSSFSGTSIFTATQPSALTAGARLLDIGDGASGNNILLQIASSGSTGQLGVYSGTTGAFASSASALTSGQMQLLESTLLSSGATFYVNGQAGTTNSSMTSIPNTSRTSNFLGQASSGGSYYPGKVAEVWLFDTGLGTARSAVLRTYLAQKYQVYSVVPEAPVISVPAGTLLMPTPVVISSSPGVITVYTTDGTTPTVSSLIYTGTPIVVNYSETLKAMAIKSGVSSSVTSAAYTLDSSQWPAPSSGDTTTPTINIQLPVPSL